MLVSHLMEGPLLQRDGWMKGGLIAQLPAGL